MDRRSRRKSIFILAGGLWLFAIFVGLSILFRYQTTAAPKAKAPHKWPQTSELAANPTGYTLVMALHPRCPCSRASIGELQNIMAYFPETLSTYLLFYKPQSFPEDWEKDALWHQAANIPGVTRIIDSNRHEGQIFNAITSGQSALYSPEGLLLFSGGITAGRGHYGDNPGKTTVINAIRTSNTTFKETLTYGCPIVESNHHQKGADSLCQMSNSPR